MTSNPPSSAVTAETPQEIEAGQWRGDGTAARRTFWDAPAWRTGRKVGRTIYAQMGDRPDDSDPLIGVMDTPDLARLVVRAVNATLAHLAPGDEGVVR